MTTSLHNEVFVKKEIVKAGEKQIYPWQKNVLFSKMWNYGQ